ncbi:MULTISPECIES: phosphate signaling complex protein PhoU [Thiomicrorhabdus]|uniref:Phosphate-specific transport system accessory protein PhoU n=1 Tax=Thiomicrorhabdus heinhorstiae TaxID=2748010 RepID=A0ABS0BTL7_9GAMM|nr:MULTISPECIES: phosphate signaling complex protein PhoU [Thiomicrorhabdus]MBF6057187.1 phosphate signaling complex protein PhoU [Thiomicrorhabdus heinhorstiae]
MQNSEYNRHISERMNRNLEDLFNQVLEMGGLVERQLEHTIEALKCDNKDIIQEVNRIDKIINKEEMEIDRLSAGVLARQQPTASDLRLIIIAIRIAVDLERMGDEAVKIAKLAGVMADTPYGCQTMPGYRALMEMTVCGMDMLSKAMDAFANLDLANVVTIVGDEERMDVALQEAMADMEEAFSSSDIECKYLLEMVLALRASERITDHAANIAESMVYLTEGKDVRHMNTEKLSQFMAELEAENSSES